MLIGQFSLFCAAQMIKTLGFCRKDAKQSDVKLYRFCEGMNDALELACKKSGVSINSGNVSQEDIGR